MNQEINLFDTAEPVADVTAEPGPSSPGSDLVPASVREMVEGDMAAIMKGARITVIENAEQRESVNNLCEWAQKSWKMFDEKRKEVKDPHRLKADAVDTYFRKPLSVFKQTEKDSIQAMRVWDQKKLDRLAEEKRIQDKKEADERARLEKIDADKKIEEEKAFSSAEQFYKAADAETDPVRKAQLMGKGRAMEAKANQARQEQEKAKEEIKTINENPVITYPSAPKPKGLVVKYKYTGEVTNIEEFVKYCVANKKYHYLQADQDALNARAEADEEKFSEPGARVIKTDASTFRPARRK